MKEVFGDVMDVIEGLSLSKEMLSLSQKVSLISPKRYFRCSKEILSHPQYLHSFHFVLSGTCETYIYNNV